MIETGVVPAALPLAEARAHLRLGAGADDAAVAGWMRAATEACEAFVGMALVVRDCVEILPIDGSWQRLALAPVKAITSVEGVPAEGAAFALPVDAYAVDIGRHGEGLVRVMRPGAAGRMRVAYRAGLVASAGEVPEALRQGMLMLCARMARARDGEAEAAVPGATVEMLWRAWRRMRIG